MQKQAFETLTIPKRFYRKLEMDMDYLLSYKGIAIQSIILFGSVARGNCKITSDLDLLIITKEPVDRHIRGDIASYLDEEIEAVATDVVFYSEEVFREADSLFARQIKKDGIIIFAKEEEDETK